MVLIQDITEVEREVLCLSTGWIGHQSIAAHLGEEESVSGSTTKGWVRPKPRHKNCKHLPSAWTRQLEEIPHKAGQK